MVHNITSLHINFVNCEILKPTYNPN